MSGVLIANVCVSGNIDKVHFRMGFLEDMISHFIIIMPISIIRATVHNSHYHSMNPNSKYLLWEFDSFLTKLMREMPTVPFLFYIVDQCFFNMLYLDFHFYQNYLQALVKNPRA